MKLLRLTTLSQSQAASGKTDKELSAWLEDLPRGDAEAFGASLRDVLQELNRRLVPVGARFELTERLRPAVNDACAMLVARYKNSPLPLTEDEQRTAELVRQLYLELAAGFKIAANEQAELWERHARAPAPLALQLSIQRAILGLGRALLECYRVYAPEPPQLWHDLHTLYRNAETARLLSQPIEACRDAEETALSIKQAYLRVAVLAMANPYHLMQGEAEELYRRLGRWLNFVQIRVPQRPAELAGRFAVDLASDFPARYLPQNVRLPPLREARVLDLEQLIGTIDAHIAHSVETLAAGPGPLSTRMQRDMYVRFRQALAGRGERRSERRPTVARLVLVEGLSACHFYLNGRQPFEPEREEAQWSAARTGGTSKTADLRLLGDDEPNARPADAPDRRLSRFKTYDREADDVWRKAHLVQPEQPQRQSRTPHRVAVWHRKNESEGGLALFCPENCPMQVRVGEIVIYADQDALDPAAWRIGTIRWLRTRGNGGVELGIKHLAPNGYAVGTRAVSGPGMGSEYLRAIVAPRINPLQGEATLITSAGVYDVGTVLQLSMKAQLLHVRLTELIETSRQFAHFRFAVTEAPAAGPRPPASRR